MGRGECGQNISGGGGSRASCSKRKRSENASANPPREEGKESLQCRDSPDEGIEKHQDRQETGRREDRGQIRAGGDIQPQWNSTNLSIHQASTTKKNRDRIERTGRAWKMVHRSDKGSVERSCEKKILTMK